MSDLIAFVQLFMGAAVFCIGDGARPALGSVGLEVAAKRGVHQAAPLKWLM